MVIRGLLMFAVLGVLNPASAHELPTIEDLAALRDLSTLQGSLALSPDGRWLVTFQARPDSAHNEVRYDLLLLPTRGAANPRTIGDGGGIILHDDADGRRTGGLLDRIPRWSPDGRWIAYLAEREGRAEIWRSNLHGARERVADLPGDVRDFTWINDDHVVVHMATPRATLTRQRSEQIAYGFRVTEQFSAAFAMLPNPDVEGASTNVTINVRSGASAPATAEEAALLGARPPSNARIGPRDPHSGVATPPVALFLRTANSAEASCTAPECAGRLREFGVLTSGDVWFSKLEGFNDADQGVYVWSPASDTVRALRRGDERNSACTANTTHLFCVQEFATQPLRITAIDIASGALSILYDPNPTWTRFTSPRIERLQFRDQAGLDSHAHLVFPADYVEGRQYPMVIVQYRSRGFLRGGTGGEYPIFPLSARGYFVLSVGRPDATARAAVTARDQLDRELYVGDEEERMKLDSLDGLIAQVAARRLVDPDAIAITGMSDGAETLFWALRRRHFAAAVASSPPIDPSHFTMTEDDVRLQMVRLGIMGPWPGHANPWWEHNAAIYYADQLQTPLLMNLPDSEALHGMPLHTRLRELGVPVETYIYPGLYHIKWRASAMIETQRRAMDWIDFWLQDRENTDPRDPSRIERWRALRAQTHR